MAVPTITSVSPALGPTGGGNLVEVDGTNFELWVIPPPSPGPLPPPTPTVRVSFGGVPGTSVLVVSTTRLFVRAPKSPLAPVKPDYGEGPVDVEVANLQPSGVPVVGEVVTAAAAYAYQRANLAIESDLLRFVRTLIRELRLQIHPNVSLTTHTDWDENPEDGKNDPGLTTLPGLALIGPDLDENRFYSRNDQPVYDVLPSGEHVVRRVPDTINISFDLIGIVDSKMTSINLMAAARAFFELNKYVSFVKDPAHPELGSVAHPVMLNREGMVSGRSPNASNLRTFSCRFVVFGFNLEDLTGFPGSQIISRTADVHEVDLLDVVQIPPEE